MTEYIHSGIAGKINRIVKPHIGNILVTSEFGNAKESTLTEDVLKTAVNDINRIKYAVTYKGEKATIDALPTTGNTKGDMWNVTENGHNYAWTGSEWDDLGGTAVGEESSEWEWNPTPFYEETLASQFEYNPDLPWYAGKHIDISNSVDNNNKLTHLLLIVERVKPSYGGTPTTRNGSGLLFCLPLLGNSSSNITQGYYIFGKTNTETYGNNVKHFLCITPYHKFTKIKYFFHGYNPSSYAIDNSPLETPFETILTNDIILYQSDIVISSDLGVGTTIKAYTKKDN